MTILDQPIRVDREAERISVFNGGASLDFNGNEQLRREAMRFYEQAPRMAQAMLSIHAVPANDSGEVVLPGEFVDMLGDLLRDAGVLP